MGHDRATDGLEIGPGIVDGPDKVTVAPSHDTLAIQKNPDPSE